MDIDLRLIGITDRRYSGVPVKSAVEEAIKGGIKTIQLREKEISDREFYLEALSIRKVTRKECVSLFINDRVDIALLSNADGIHIGKEDLPVEAIKKLFKGCIGKTVKSIEEAIVAEKMGVDYVATGPFYRSETKPQNITMNKDFLEEMVKTVSIPVIVIGGINKDNAPDLLQSGAHGIAVSRALFSGNILNNARELSKACNLYGSN